MKVLKHRCICDESSMFYMVSWGKFEHRDKTYSFVASLIETDYGPENRMYIREYGNRKAIQDIQQESARDDTMIEWFCDRLDEEDEALEDTKEETIEPVVGVCSYCNGVMTDANLMLHKDGMCLETQAQG